MGEEKRLAGREDIMVSMREATTEGKEEMTEKEMDEVTTVFRSFETGLREATILSKDLHAAMKMLGLNPMEQEVIDLTNNIVKNGFIYFPDFCKTILDKFRQDDEEVFRQNMFKMLCGTEPFPSKFKAKKYKLHDHFITKKNFFHIMSNLPEEVSEEDIELMFSYADKDGDDKISYQEFQVMINPPLVNTDNQGQRKASKRVTIQTTEPEILSVTNFSYQVTNHDTRGQDSQVLDGWDIQGSGIHLLEY